MKFFQTVVAVIVGLLVFTIIPVMFFTIMFIAASKEQPVTIVENSILHLKLNRPIREREVNDPFAELVPGFGPEQGIGLIELRKALENAMNDENVKGILLEVPYIQAGVSSSQEIRNMLEEFKTSGKFIISYADTYTEGGYYVASVADEIYMAPAFGILEFNGLNSEHLYFKKTLDKLGIEPQVFKAGKFKNAAESFTATEMSESEEIQVKAYVNSIYDEIMTDISESRGIAKDELKNIADSMMIRNEGDGVRYGLLDKLAYKDEVIDIIKDKIGVDREEKIPFISHSFYNKSIQEDYSADHSIAVLIAEGNIISGGDIPETIASEDFIKELRSLRDNDRIDAIVIRINSPGGSALASDLMWREIKLTAEKKPVIASMSDVAASGGYYLAMAADTIVAMPTTITGSIGVIGMYFNLSELLNEKLGITSDNYKTGEYSDLLNVTRPISEDEVQIVQTMIEESYKTFASKAAEDRGMTFEELNELAQGRVWTGEDAKDINLIDVFGDLEEAVKIAAVKAEVGENYKVKYFPRQKPFIEQLLTEMGGGPQSIFKNQAAELEPYVKLLVELDQRRGVQARLPYDIRIDL